MRYAVIFIVGAFFLYVGEWGYRSFLRPIDLPTPQMLALAEHFNAHGLKGHIYPVRHGFRHSEVRAAAAFQIDGFPLPISFEESPSSAAAQAHYELMSRGSNLMHPQRNGQLVLYLPMWGADTEPMAMKVKNAFSSFNPGT
jgi:hypothetical protein